MERLKCKLCLRIFANGRALGGHMRSHMLNLYVPEQEQENEGEETENPASFSSSHEAEEEEKIEDKTSLLGYKLRENPKKSVRLVDPEFSFADNAGGSVVLQDRESETESSKNPIRRRSKRIRKSGFSRVKKQPSFCKTESCWAEQEPVSSISETSPEEDVAYCLMMLSRDKWRRQIDEQETDQFEVGEGVKNHEFELDQFEDFNVARAVTTRNRVRGKYRCETCNKIFRSYQALGGHRASHKRIKLATTSTNSFPTQELTMAEAADDSIAYANANANANANASGFAAGEEKIHECPVCCRVFASGQALGGHKRSHVTGIAATNTTTIMSLSKPITPPPPPTPPPAATKFGRETLIDLNLPAPIDDDVELSAVSDAEFVNSFRR